MNSHSKICTNFPQVQNLAVSREKEATECDQTESDQTRHYAFLESNKALFGMQ
jgi:hypothetical protein